MSGNEARNTSSSSEQIPLEALGPSERRTNDQEGHATVNDSLADMAATPPPLGVKLTVYRLFNMTAMFAFCIEKDILAYKSQSITPTTLDLVSGVLAVV